MGKLEIQQEPRYFWFKLGILRSNIPRDVGEYICALAISVRLKEIQEEQNLPSLGRSSFAKRRRAKALGCCVRCGRYNHVAGHCKTDICSENRSLRLELIQSGQSKVLESDLKRPLSFLCFNLIGFIVFNK